MLISSEKIYKAADYLRLSKEDGDFSFSGKKMLIVCLVNKLNGKNLKHRDN